MRGRAFRRFRGKADMRRFQTVKAYLFLFPFLAFFIVVTVISRSLRRIPLPVWTARGQNVVRRIEQFQVRVHGPAVLAGVRDAGFPAPRPGPRHDRDRDLHRAPLREDQALGGVSTHFLPSLCHARSRGGHPLVLHILPIHVPPRPAVEAVRRGQAGIHHSLERALDTSHHHPLGMDGIYLAHHLFHAGLHSKGATARRRRWTAPPGSRRRTTSRCRC